MEDRLVDAESQVARDLDLNSIFSVRSKFGFSDRADCPPHRAGAPDDVRAESAKRAGVLPTYRLVDTCAAEFEAYTPYYYSTYGDRKRGQGERQEARS